MGRVPLGGIILLTVFVKKLLNNPDKKYHEDEKNIKQQVEEDMKNMNFQQGREYILKKKKEKWDNIKNDIPKKIGKAIVISFLIAIVITLVVVITGTSNPISYFPNIWGKVAILTTIVSLFSLEKPRFDTDYAKSLLKDIYEKEICQPILDEHNYHNVEFGIASIPDTTIGLVSGDKYSRTNNSFTCDEFKYRNIEYYHETKYEDKDGNTHTQEVRTFYGSEIFIPCEIMIENTVRIIPSITKNSGKEYIYISKGRLEGEEHVDIEDIEFNQEFEVYSRNPHDAFLFLNSQRIEYLKQLRKKYAIVMVIKKEGIYIAIDRISKFFELPDIKSENDPTEYFENNIKNLETMLHELKKVI